MSVLGAFHVSTASTASGCGLTPCLSTILPRYLIESLRISHFDGSKSPSPILPFKCSIYVKTGLSDSSSYDDGRSGKFEQLDKPSSVSDFIENNL